MNANLNFGSLSKQLPEQELWRLLQDLIASKVELADATVQQLDDPPGIAAGGRFVNKPSGPDKRAGY